VAESLRHGHRYRRKGPIPEPRSAEHRTYGSRPASLSVRSFTLQLLFGWAHLADPVGSRTTRFVHGRTV
jgi:hypothetical protein